MKTFKVLCLLTASFAAVAQHHRCPSTWAPSLRLLLHPIAEEQWLKDNQLGNIYSPDWPRSKKLPKEGKVIAYAKFSRHRGHD
jgi:hypothetical protein